MGFWQAVNPAKRCIRAEDSRTAGGLAGGGTAAARNKGGAAAEGAGSPRSGLSEAQRAAERRGTAGRPERDREETVWPRGSSKSKTASKAKGGKNPRTNGEAADKTTPRRPGERQDGAKRGRAERSRSGATQRSSHPEHNASGLPIYRASRTCCGREAVWSLQRAVRAASDYCAIN